MALRDQQAHPAPVAVPGSQQPAAGSPVLAAGPGVRQASAATDQSARLDGQGRHEQGGADDRGEASALPHH